MRAALILVFLSMGGIIAAQQEEERPWGRPTTERNRERISVIEERQNGLRDSLERLTTRIDRIEEWGIYILLGTGGAFGTAGGSIGLMMGRRNGRKRTDDTRS